MIVVAIIGILAAIAIPNFIRFQARSKQSEAKTNLKAYFTAQKAFYGEKDRYSASSEIGFAPEANNRYDYYGPGTVGNPAITPVVDFNAAWVRPGAAPPTGYAQISRDTSRYGVAQADPGNATVGEYLLGMGYASYNGIAGMTPVTICPMCATGMLAVGNVDNDAAQDSWFIYTDDVGGVTSAPCGGDEGGTLRAGNPWNGANDVQCSGVTTP